MSKSYDWESDTDSVCGIETVCDRLNQYTYQPVPLTTSHSTALALPSSNNSTTLVPSSEQGSMISKRYHPYFNQLSSSFTNTSSPSSASVSSYDETSIRNKT